MKTILGITIFLFGVNVFACAGCLDIYPETLVLDSEITSTLISLNPELKDESKSISLKSISCSKPNLFGNPSEASCQIEGTMSDTGQYINIGPSAASSLVLYAQLQNMTVEIDGRVSDDWVRTGERTKIALLNQTMEGSSVSIPEINVGKLFCPLVKGQNRCEIELTVLNVSLLYAQ